MILNRIDRGLRALEKSLVVGSWLVTLFITFMIVLDVFLRFFFNKPLPASFEISEVIIPFIVFFAIPAALTENAHVQVSLVTMRLPAKVQFACKIATNIIGFLTCMVFFYYSFLRAWDSFLIREEILAAIRIPWWPGKFAMPLGMLMFGLRYLIILFLDLGRDQKTIEIRG